jgi:hypothetical protein
MTAIVTNNILYLLRLILAAIQHLLAKLGP